MRNQALVDSLSVEQFSANHTVIRVKGGALLVSYDSKVAYIDNQGVITLGQNWDYSKTSTNSVVRFLNLSYVDLKFRINNREIKVTNRYKEI